MVWTHVPTRDVPTRDVPTFPELSICFNKVCRICKKSQASKKDLQPNQDLEKAKCIYPPKENTVKKSERHFFTLLCKGNIYFFS